MKFLLIGLSLLWADSLSAIGWGTSPPNERYPSRYQMLTKNSIEGVAISVGGERGFFLASLSPNISGLVQIDFDDRVISLNQIHRALLIAAEDLEDYHRLRSAERYDWWMIRRSKNSLPGIESLNYDNYVWWKELVRDKQVEVSTRGIEGDFLDDEVLFRRLQKMARSGKIEIMKLNLNNRDKFRHKLTQIQLRLGGVSIIDLSNVWWNFYIGPRVILQLVRSSRDILDEKTIWIFSNLHDDKFWTYFGFSSKHLLAQESSFVNLAKLVSTQYSHILDEMRPIEGLNIELSEWLPSGAECSTLLSGQIDLLRSQLKIK